MVLLLTANDIDGLIVHNTSCGFGPWHGHWGNCCPFIIENTIFLTLIKFIIIILSWTSKNENVLLILIIDVCDTEFLSAIVHVSFFLYYSIVFGIIKPGLLILIFTRHLHILPYSNYKYIWIPSRYSSVTLWVYYLTYE